MSKDCTTLEIIYCWTMAMLTFTLKIDRQMGRCVDRLKARIFQTQVGKYGWKKLKLCVFK